MTALATDMSSIEDRVANDIVQILRDTLNTGDMSQHLLTIIILKFSCQSGIKCVLNGKPITMNMDGLSLVTMIWANEKC